ncbi:MAG: hypothetical protein J6Y02_08455 [Pseudobutyrivibrio sp.]|nr:hypothetical protein [Pseudobutyrivibrio sp.]
MAKGAYIGVSSVARKAKKMYIGVGGVARKVKKAYIGVSGVAKLWWSGENQRTLLSRNTGSTVYSTNDNPPIQNFNATGTVSVNAAFYIKYDEKRERFLGFTATSSSSNSQVYSMLLDGSTWTYLYELDNYSSSYRADPKNTVIEDDYIYMAAGSRGHISKYSLLTGELISTSSAASYYAPSGNNAWWNYINGYFIMLGTESSSNSLYLNYRSSSSSSYTSKYIQSPKFGTNVSYRSRFGTYEPSIWYDNNKYYIAITPENSTGPYDNHIYVLSGTSPSNIAQTIEYSIDSSAQRTQAHMVGYAFGGIILTMPTNASVSLRGTHKLGVNSKTDTIISSTTLPQGSSSSGVASTHYTGKKLYVMMSVVGPTTSSSMVYMSGEDWTVVTIPSGIFHFITSTIKE